MNTVGIKRFAATALGAAALAGSFALAGAGTASADTPTQPTGQVTVVKPGEAGPKVTRHEANGGAQTNHVSSWQTTYYDGYAWQANVRVDYGRTGSWTHCSDGSDHYGPLVGPGYWIFGGNCYGYGYITNYGWYDG